MHGVSVLRDFECLGWVLRSGSTLGFEEVVVFPYFGMGLGLHLAERCFGCRHRLVCKLEGDECKVASWLIAAS